MAEFIFNDEIEPLRIKNQKGEVFKEYTVNTGDVALMKKWMRSLSDVSKIVDQSIKDERVLDQLQNAQKHIITEVLGEGAYEELLVIFKNHVWRMQGLVNYLANYLQKTLQEDLERKYD